MDIVRTLLAALIYPGLVTAVVAGTLYGLIVARRPTNPRLGAALTYREGAAALASVLLAAAALATLPWPFHPLAPGAAWLWAWAGFELAFLLPLLPPLMAGSPSLVRAAIREAQLGVLARAVLWGGLAVGLAVHDSWSATLLPAHLLALAVALAALPAAIGWGPFAPEERVSPGGLAVGLPADALALEAWARDLRCGALVAATVVAVLPVAVGPAALGTVIVAAGLLALLLALRQFNGRFPRTTLPAALRGYTLWVLPSAALAAIALALAGRL